MPLRIPRFVLQITIYDESSNVSKESKKKKKKKTTVHEVRGMILLNSVTQQIWNNTDDTLVCQSYEI